MTGRFPALLLLAAAGCTPAAPLATLPPTVVSVAKPVQREMVDAETFTGRTEGSEFVEVRARVSGYLEKVHFKPGTRVKSGDLLFEIDAAPYQVALDQAEGELARVKARVLRLNADAGRAQDLFRRKAIGREEFDKISGDQAEAVASVHSAEAAVDRAKLDLSWTKVKAPISGLVSRDLVNAGNLVAADRTLLTTIIQQDPMYVYFDVDERTVLHVLKLIREGKFKSARENRVPIRMGLADDENYPHEGYVNFVDNRVDPATGTMRLRGTFPNPTLANTAVAITPGLFAKVRMEFSAPYQALLVSERVILSDQSQKYVYVVNDRGEVERRDLRLGRLEGGWRVVEAGLKPDERVVVNGLLRVRPGVVVDAKESRMPGGPVAGANATAARPATAEPRKD